MDRKQILPFALMAILILVMIFAVGTRFPDFHPRANPPPTAFTPLMSVPQATLASVPSNCRDWSDRNMEDVNSMHLVCIKGIVWGVEESGKYGGRSIFFTAEKKNGFYSWDNFNPKLRSEFRKGDCIMITGFLSSRSIWSATQQLCP